MPTQVTNYQCPACTGPLHFDSATGKLTCDYCGTSYEVAEIEALFAEKEQKAAEAKKTADQKTAPELIREIRAACGEDVFILALCHRNDQLPLWAGLDVPVVLAGHAHGGIVRLPGLGGVFGTHYEFFPGDDAGLYVQDGTQLYVSRGLGPSRRLPIRVCNAPELPVLTLVRGEI